MDEEEIISKEIPSCVNIVNQPSTEPITPIFKFNYNTFISFLYANKQNIKK